MEKIILVKQVIGTDSVKQDSTTRVMVHTWKDTVLNPMDENALTVARTKTKMQPIDQFQYSGRCFCGTY